MNTSTLALYIDDHTITSDLVPVLCLLPCLTPEAVDAMCHYLIHEYTLEQRLAMHMQHFPEHYL